MRLPMPLAAPVTMQTLPSSRFMDVLPWIVCRQDSAGARRGPWYQWSGGGRHEVARARQFDRHAVGVAQALVAQSLAQARGGLDHEVEDRVLLDAAADRVRARPTGPDADVVAAVGLVGERHHHLLLEERDGGSDVAQVRSAGGGGELLG